MIEWLKHHLIIAALIMVVLVSSAWTIPLVIVMNRADRAARDADNSAACVKSVVTQIINRSGKVAEAIRKRDDAFHAVFAVVQQDRAEAERRFELYRTAEEEYERVRRENPVPPSPELVCPS